MIILRAALLQELDELSQLCLRSKASWGYDAAFMTACIPVLTLRADDLGTSHVQVAERNGQPVGIAQLRLDGPESSLDKLFVSPGSFRTDIGRQLFAWATVAARSLGARTLTIDADPGAAGFYVRMGAKPAGDVASEVLPERRLPRFKVNLAASVTPS